MVYRAEQRGIISNGVKKTSGNGEPSFVPASALVENHPHSTRSTKKAYFRLN